MRPLLLLSAAALLIGAAPAKKPLTPGEIVAAAPAAAWRTIPADDLLVMDLASGGRVIIQLAPRFAPVHVGNIKALARAGYWDGATVYRVQDNYVAQWGLNESDALCSRGPDKSPIECRKRDMPAKRERKVGCIVEREIPVPRKPKDQGFVHRLNHLEGLDVQIFERIARRRAGVTLYDDLLAAGAARSGLLFRRRRVPRHRRCRKGRRGGDRLFR